MRHIFGTLNSNRIEIKFYGPFPITVGEVLDKFISEKFTNFNVTVNGKPEQLDTVLVKPSMIEIFFGEQIKTVNLPQVVWRDEHLAVVFKPPLMATQPTRFASEPHLKGFLTEMFGPQIHIPSRLDFGVSGLILVSLTSKTHKFVHNLYEKKLIKKYYCFKSLNSVPWLYRYIETNIVTNPLHPATRLVSRGQGAQSLFINLKIFTDYGWIYVVRIFTGKTHQIRLHSKYLGIPIIGDPFYNPSAQPKSFELCCFCLSFNYLGQDHTFFIPKNLSPTWLSLEKVIEMQDLWFI